MTATLQTFGGGTTDFILDPSNSAKPLANTPYTILDAVTMLPATGLLDAAGVATTQLVSDSHGRYAGSAVLEGSAYYLEATGSDATVYRFGPQVTTTAAAAAVDVLPQVSTLTTSAQAAATQATAAAASAQAAADSASGANDTSVSALINSTTSLTRAKIASIALGPKSDAFILRSSSDGDQASQLAAFFADSSLSGIRRVIGYAQAASNVSVPAGVRVDARKATLEATSSGQTLLTLAAGARLEGGSLLGKSTDYVAGTGTPTAIGVNLTGDKCVVEDVEVTGFAGAGVRLINASNAFVGGMRVYGVDGIGSIVIPNADSACFGVYILGGCTDVDVEDLRVQNVSIGLIGSYDTTGLSIQYARFRHIPGQHGVYTQTGTDLLIDDVRGYDVALNLVKMQLSASLTGDTTGMTIQNVIGRTIGDNVVSVNNPATDLSTAVKAKAVNIGNITGYNASRVVYLGSIRGGSVGTIVGHSCTTDGVTVIDSQDMLVENVNIIGAGRRGILFNTQTGAVTARVKVMGAKIRDAAGGNVTNAKYGVQISGNGAPDGTDLTFDGLEVTSTNGFMDYAFYNASGDQATMTLRNTSLANGVLQDIRAISGPVKFKELTNVRYGTSLNMPVQGQTNMAPAVAVNNLVAETYDAVLKTLAQASMTAGVLYAARLFVPQERTLSTIWYSLATSGATLTAGQNLIGVYNEAGALIAQTGDQSTNFAAAAGDKSAALTTPVTVPAGSYLHIGVIFNGTTSPQFRGINGTSFPNVALTAAAQSRYATGGTGQTALPSTLPTLTANNAANSAPWFGIA